MSLPGKQKINSVNYLTERLSAVPYDEAFFAFHFRGAADRWGSKRASRIDWE
jgi:hypothetical protein